MTFLTFKLLLSSFHAVEGLIEIGKLTIRETKKKLIRISDSNLIFRLSGSKLESELRETFREKKGGGQRDRVGPGFDTVIN